MIIETLYMIGRNLLWQSALLASIIYCMLYILPRSHITARYRVALGGFFGAILLLALPFLPAIPFVVNLTPGILLPVNPALLAQTSGEVLTEAINVSEIVTVNDPKILSVFPFASVLVGLWLAGCLFALLRLGMAVWQGRELLSNSTSVSIKGAAPLSRNVNIMRNSSVKAPLVFGLRKPTIVVPNNFSLDLNKAETRVILEHEIAHITRNDLWTNFAQRIVLAVLWWCLPLYWINRQIGAERENVCDAIATAHISKILPATDNPARMLAGALVRFAEQKSNMRTPALTIGINPQAKFLAKRVQLLCDNSPVPQLSKKLLLSTSLAIPLTLLMLSIITPRALADSPPDSITSTDKIILSAPQTITSAAIPPKTEVVIPPKTGINIVQGRLTSKYGVVRKRFGSKVHTGIDIANSSGTPIYAPADARIIEATEIYKNNSKWGKVVVIETAGGIETVFAHLKDYNVTTGQIIKAGVKIAEVGNTGASTGPHVHIETYIDGQHVDPFTVWPNFPN